MRECRERVPVQLALFENPECCLCGYYALARNLVVDDVDGGLYVYLCEECSAVYESSGWLLWRDRGLM